MIDYNTKLKLEGLRLSNKHEGMFGVLATKKFFLDHHN